MAARALGNGPARGVLVDTKLVVTVTVKIESKSKEIYVNTPRDDWMEWTTTPDEAPELVHSIAYAARELYQNILEDVLADLRGQVPA
jgi:hypothetical protein